MGFVDGGVCVSAAALRSASLVSGFVSLIFINRMRFGHGYRHLGLKLGMLRGRHARRGRMSTAYTMEKPCV